MSGTMPVRPLTQNFSGNIIHAKVLILIDQNREERKKERKNLMILLQKINYSLILNES